MPSQALFFLVGMELKREVIEGHLSSLRAASLPAFAAVGERFLDYRTGLLAPYHLRQASEHFPAAGDSLPVYCPAQALKLAAVEPDASAGGAVVDLDALTLGHHQRRVGAGRPGCRRIAPRDQVFCWLPWLS